MSSPLPDISATSPGDALGDSAQAPLPQIGVGSRGKRGKPSGGLLNRIGGMRAPGAPSRSQSEARANLHIVRKEPGETPPAPRPTPGPGLTAKGAPLRNPREVPKTGEARDERDAARAGMSQDTRRAHEGWSAKTQDAFNKLTRATQDIDRRGGDDLLSAHFRSLRERRSRQAREDRRPGPTPEHRARRDEQYRKMRETLDSTGDAPDDQP